MPDVIFKGETDLPSRSVSFQIRDASGALVPALTQADVTIKTAKSGLNFGASAATLVERTGSVGGAIYDLTFTAPEVAIVGDLKFEVSSGSTTIATVSGYVTIRDPATIADAVLDAMPVDHTIPGSYGEQLARPVAVVVGAAGNTALAFKTNLTSVAPDFWKDAWVSFLSGALKDQVHKVLMFDAVAKVITVVNAFTGVPADGDRFVLVNR